MCFFFFISLAVSAISFILNQRAWTKFQVFQLAQYSLLSVQIIIEKYLMEHQYLSGYTVLGGEGLIGIIISTLYLVFIEKRCLLIQQINMDIL